MFDFSKESNCSSVDTQTHEARKGFQRARKQLKKRKVGFGCVKGEEPFIRKRNSYNKLLKKTKWDLWYAFLEQYLNESYEPNPWSLINKCAKKASSSDSFFYFLKKEDGTLTFSWLESASVLLNKFLLKTRWCVRLWLTNTLV